jgi:hypothetical protein
LPNQALESLEQTKEELKITKILVAMPTTFLLEGVLCKIPTVLISFKSKKVRTSSRLMIEELEHLKGINNLDNIFLVHNRNDLFATLTKLTASSSLFPDNSELNYFVNWDSKTFMQKFIEAVEENLLVH